MLPQNGGNQMGRSSIGKCPRCEERTLESFSTHQYCASCNYGSSVDAFDVAVPKWALDAVAKKQIERKPAPESEHEALQPIAV